MQTLVVLSAVVAVALAAPTLLEQGSEDFKKFTNIPEIFKRERKSLQESSNFNPTTGVSISQPSTSHISEFGVSGRSFGLKKPIIIKKKPVGYQVYRDSDEVPAESGETCGSHVKVKFCDGMTKAKSSTTEDANTQITEEDMKQSITLAKEAIENLQRDLNTVEKKPGTQTSSWNHGNSESDAELHQDIEVAREALEHIHKNFGNFESMSLHATTFKEATVVPEPQFTIAKTEEQRLAQWKEAIDTIQKNVEIAKNIEDSFRVTPDSETSSLVAEDTIVENDKQGLNKKIDQNQPTSEDVLKKQENKIETESCKVEQAHKNESENKNIQDGLVVDDMASSASSISEKEIKEDQSSQLLPENKIDQSLKIDKSQEDTHKEKDTEVNTMALDDLTQKTAAFESLKSTENNKDEKDTNIPFDGSEESVTVSTTGMKSIESEDMLIENQKKATVPTENLEKLETDEHFKELNSNNKKEENTQADLHTEETKNTDTLFAKSAEEVPTNTQQEIMSDISDQQDMAANEPEKHFAFAKMTNNEDMKVQQEIFPSNNHPKQMELQQHQSMFHPEMRTTEDMKTMHQQFMVDPKTRALWAEDKNMQLQRESMKPSQGIHSHMVQHPGHKHHITHGMNNQNFDIPSSHGMHSRFPEHFITQEKSADPDMQTYFMSMRDGTAMAPENQRFRWKPTHDAPRSAYGSPATPVSGPLSGGAVGVFPNANLGSCGIPLLLSCNPSVVSGSLAKPGSAPFSGPSYRSEDDFTFLTKRDVKKTHEKLPSTMHRTSKTNLKTNAPFEFEAKH